jgi:hypothetical protein
MLLFLLQCPMVGAGETARVGGTLFTVGTDRIRMVWPNARVTLTNLDNAVRSTTVSDNLGEYSFSDVIPGEYEVQVNLAGFRTATLRTTLPESGDVRLDFQLDPEAPEWRIEVTAHATGVDVSSSRGAPLNSVRELSNL